MEMGRKSACPLGAGTLGIGRIEACFYCRGTNPDETDILMSLVNGAYITGADNRKNQAGSWSSPGAVGRSLSRRLNTSHSEMYSSGSLALVGMRLEVWYCVSVDILA